MTLVLDSGGISALAGQRAPGPGRGQLRTATGRAGTISAVDAIVAAYADSCPNPSSSPATPRT
jgi:hypothetical protein